MNFDLSDDQLALRDGIRGLCEGRFPMKRVRAGFDREAFAELADAGVFSLRGDGFGVADATVVFEELGRALLPGPLVWSYLGHDDVGGVLGGLEVAQRTAPWLIEHRDQLDALLVLDGHEVKVVEAAHLEAGDELPRPLDPLTPVQRVSTLPAGRMVGGTDLLTRLRREGAVVTGAFLVGLAQAACDLAVAYAKERRQFGRPIGSFQAIKHLLADMTVRAEVARTAVHAAACILDDPGLGDPDRAVSGAKLLAGEAAILNGKTCVQVHGGMGFTWEVDAHLFLKRAWVLDTAFGSADHHADAVAATLPAVDGFGVAKAR
jgi:alkylation response protein AidB-like acyl-CoA dehydrogenase